MQESEKFKVGFFISNYTDINDTKYLINAIEMQGGKIFIETSDYIVAEFQKDLSGGRKLVMENTYFWCRIR